MKSTLLTLVIFSVLSHTVVSGPDYCGLQPESGVCLAYIPSFYFDASSNTCKEFIYGGCMGNSNRFTTKEQCEQSCQ
ncbi:hypothetical protein Btru_050298 [Bulinus truncatus]|nr:hypothetical protein Btru_050298 [Bulinus truncatus]